MTNEGFERAITIKEEIAEIQGKIEKITSAIIRAKSCFDANYSFDISLSGTNLPVYLSGEKLKTYLSFLEELRKEYYSDIRVLQTEFKRLK